MQSSLNDLLDCAIEAARAAGSHATENPYRRTDIDSSTAHDIKLHLDRECQEIATEVILSRFPDHNILGEEDSPEAVNSKSEIGNQKSSLEWVIDPIDGTVNFFHGLPLWCSSVAVRLKGESLAGAVFAPESDLLYTATTECASTVNGEPIHVSEIDRVDEAMLLTGLNLKKDGDVSVFDTVRMLSETFRKTRILGSAALDMCRVASGQAEAYWEAGIYTWDIAAAELIVRQAGGRTCVIEQLGEPHRVSFMATNDRLHGAFRDLLKASAQG